MKICLTALLMTLCLTATAEQPGAYTWSSTACPKCQSTIVYQAWYPDGSPLVAEGMSGANAGALVAMSLIKDTLVLSLGLSISREPTLTLALRESVRIETDSSSHMVLYAMDEPVPGFHKDDVAMLRSLDIRSLPLRPHAPASGFLFFPFDRNASHFVVVVRVGGEVFRFPFAQDPNAHDKFGDPAKVASRLVAGAVQHPPESSRVCSKNVSFVVSDDGKLVARAPEFTSKWLEKNGARYPGLCFSQTPDPHVANYLVAFAPSEAEFDEFYPSMSAPAVPSTAPGQGSSSSSDGRGAAWTYHSAGTAASTITTSTFISLPFADKIRTLYAFTYDQSGRLISRRQRAVTTRRSAGPFSSIGVNVAAAVAASHMKERLLEDAVSDFTR